MALNPKYVTAPSLQSYFVDKDTGFPLSGGKVFFYSDVNRTTYKDVFELQGNQANYTYSPLPNPLTLSAVGTIQDDNGNDVIPYYYPYEESNPNVQELYYIVVQSSEGVPQFTRSAWPNPGVSGGGNITSAEEINLVPNGQLLAHTDLPNNALVAGENAIAQGGLYIVLDDSATSTNTLTFTQLQFNSLIPQSPRNIATLTCSVPNPAEGVKKISQRWRDVSKFSTGSSPEDNTYQFGIYTQGNTNLPVTIQLYQFYGSGSASPPTVTIVQSDTFLTAGQYYSYTVTFPVPDGTIDLVNNDDYVAVEVLCPLDVPFSLGFTDLAMVPGDQTLTGPPVQTNGDMLTRGVNGWCDTPKYDGYDLYLSQILTREGMKYDHSPIGKVMISPIPIVSPNSVDATSNEMPFDGSSYTASSYSLLGIPFARLRDALIASSPVANYPVWGTGANYASAMPASTDEIVLIVNSSGAGVAQAANGSSPHATPFTFSTTATYNGVTTGSASINFQASTDLNNGVIARGIGFVTPLAAFAQGPVSTGFTISTLDANTGLYAFQNAYGISMLTVDAATLAVGSGAAKSLRISNSATSYALYFRVDGVGTVLSYESRTVLVLDLISGQSAADVAKMTASIINALQMTTITISSLPDASDYFTFQTNPGSAISYYVWYSFLDSDVDPAPGGTGIRVRLTSSDTAATALTKTLLAINSYQFAMPTSDGMFMRVGDPGSVFDTDSDTRFGFSPLTGGNNPGTYEFQQFLSHVHTETGYLTSNDGTAGPKSVAAINPSALAVDASGGSETRPVNFTVYLYTKY